MALTASAIADGTSGLPGGSNPKPTVTVADRFFSSNENVCSLTRFTTFSAQVSTSRAVPRSSRIKKAVAAEAAAQIRGRELRAQQVGELGHEVFAGKHADGALDFDETVRLDMGELAHAALHP